ncbi:MAG TPA: hypothetical protein VK607_08920 [Kofleriaceae bacterium]|nr:hypothetical protein [Kofleriaceae bacterium]
MAVPLSQQFDYEVQLEPAPDASYRGVATTLQGSVPGLAGRMPEVCVTGDDVVVCAAPSDAPPSRWLLVSLIPLRWIPILGPWLTDRYFDAGRCAGARAFTIRVPGLGARLHPGIKLRLRHRIYAGPGMPTTEDNEVTFHDDPSAPVLTFACPSHVPW